MRLSPALIISCLALFVALSGTGYAISKLPKNSVGTAQLKKAAVTSVKVKDGSLLSKDFKASERAALKGDKGEQGNAGPAGAQGPIGPSASFAWHQDPPDITLGFITLVASRDFTAPAAGRVAVGAAVSLYQSAGTGITRGLCSVVVATEANVALEAGELLEEDAKTDGEHHSVSPIVGAAIPSAGTYRAQIYCSGQNPEGGTATTRVENWSLNVVFTGTA